MSIIGLWPLNVGGFQEPTLKMQCSGIHQISQLTVSSLQGPGHCTPSCRHGLHQKSFA